MYYIISYVKQSHEVAVFSKTWVTYSSYKLSIIKLLIVQVINYKAEKIRRLQHDEVMCNILKVSTQLWTSKIL